MRDEAERLLKSVDTLLGWARAEGRAGRSGWQDIEKDANALRQAMKANANTPGRARRNSPPTSKAAARTVKTGTVRYDVLQALRGAPHGMTHHELIARFPNRAESSIRTRTSELVEMGLVKDSGHTRSTRAGNEAIVWEAT